MEEATYFTKSQRIWFPDFEEMIEKYDKDGDTSSALRAIVGYFRKELSAAEFAAYFLGQDAPGKMLHTHRKLYKRALELCMQYRNQSICQEEFDEQLLLAFRGRPTEDVFSPAFPLCGEICQLLPRILEKSRCLPLHFDGTAWNAYLKGIVTRSEYVKGYLSFGTGEHLAQLVANGVDKENFAKQYSKEISVCLSLRKLCIDYRAGLLSPDSFDTQFLALAKEFCTE